MGCSSTKLAEKVAVPSVPESAPESAPERVVTSPQTARLQRSSSMQVYVRGLSGECFAVELKQGEVVGSVRKKIAVHLDIPVAMVVLVYKDCTIGPEKNKSVLFKDGDHITVVKRAEAMQSYTVVNDAAPDWVTAQKPALLTDCSMVAEFGLDVELPDGRKIRIENMTQITRIEDAKQAALREAGIALEDLDAHILFYFGAYMGDEFQLNAFGIPWNGTQLELRRKDNMKKPF